MSDKHNGMAIIHLRHTFQESLVEPLGFVLDEIPI